MIMYSKPLLNPNAVLFFGPIPTWWGSRPWPQVEVHASDPVVVLVRYDDLPTKAVWPRVVFFGAVGMAGMAGMVGMVGMVRMVGELEEIDLHDSTHFFFTLVSSMWVFIHLLFWSVSFSVGPLTQNLVNLRGTIWATSTIGSNAVSIPGGFNHKIAGNCALLIKANWATEGL